MESERRKWGRAGRKWGGKKGYHEGKGENGEGKEGRQGMGKKGSKLGGERTLDEEKKEGRRD